MKTWSGFTSVVLMAACGCGCHASDPAGDAGVVCVNYETCGYMTWPRIMVGIIPSSAKVNPAALIGVKSIAEDGSQTVLSPGCIRVAPPLVCSYEYYSGPAETKVLLVLTGPDGVSREVEVALGTFNYCGVDIAYVPVLMGEGGSFEFGRQRFVTPCAGS